MTDERATPGERAAETPADRPLIVFVHVPKTAGSTVNALLADWSPDGAVHCERIVGDAAAMAGRAARLSWMSGHVPLDRFRAALRAATGRPLRFFTMMREPTAQIASHYNWLIEIYHRGADFYAGHPEPIRRISEHIRTSDNTDPRRIIANLEAYPGLFLNQQSRHVLGAGFDWASGQIADRLLDYEAIATEDGLAHLIRRMTGREPAQARRENESRYHVARELFDEPSVRLFLERRHFYDYALYDAVRRLNRLRAA